MVGFLDDVNPTRRNQKFCGLPILGGREQLEALKNMNISHIVFAFGNGEARLKLAEIIRAQGFYLASAVHPKAIIADSTYIGPGTVIAAGAVVNPGTRIGDNVIRNTGASVDHECIIEDGVHICPGASLGGRVTVGRAAWVGIGSTIKDRVRIGGGAIIGAGTVVLKDIPDMVSAYGVPARIRKRILRI